MPQPCAVETRARGYRVSPEALPTPRPCAVASLRVPRLAS